MRWLALADVVAIIHAVYAAFVVLGFGATIVGAIAGARWARNFALRAAHLAAILLVCVEVLIGMICPLTTLENSLRLRAGAPSYPADFIGYWIDRLIFYDAPPWVFALLYFGFAAVVALSWRRWPPRWPGSEPIRKMSTASPLGCTPDT